MKKHIKLLLSLAVILPLMTAGVAWAQEGVDDETSTTETTTLQQRLEKRKAERKIRLTASEQARLKSRCKNSQGVIKSLSGRIKGLETSRNVVYNNLVSRLTKLSENLETQGLDTTTLDTQITELETKIATFKTDLAMYKQAVSDLATMDCVSDPDGFKASLEVARAARETLTKDAAAIKTYVKETIKPTLVALHDQLEAEEGTSGENQ